MATFQDALDKVMTKLRESAVTSLSDDYVMLVAEWMNTIKEEIEDSWDWQAGRQEVSFSTAIGTREYDLSIHPRSRLLHEKPYQLPMMFDTTVSNTGYRLFKIDDTLRRRYSVQFNTQTTAEPYEFSLYKTADTTMLAFKELPEQVRTYTGFFYVPADELDELTDEFHIPMRPLVLGTLWMAAQERGEELGMDSNTLYQMYQNRLAKDIAMDMEDNDALMVAV